MRGIAVFALLVFFFLFYGHQISAQPAQQQKQLQFETPTVGPSRTPTPTPTIDPSVTVTPTIVLEDEVSGSGFSFFVYVVLSFVYIMVIHFAINTGSEFVTFLIILGFVLGGFLGYWFKSYEAGFVFGIIMSFLFFGGPQKEM